MSLIDRGKHLKQLDKLTHVFHEALLKGSAMPYGQLCEMSRAYCAVLSVMSQLEANSIYEEISDMQREAFNAIKEDS